MTGVNDIAAKISTEEKRQYLIFANHDILAFLFLANLMKDFKFSVPDNAVLPDTETNGGLTLAPKEFQVQISCI